MTRVARRTGQCLLAIAAAAPMHGALSQTSDFQGAWLEEGIPCASAFVATSKAIDFRRPASVFVPAFIITGRQLSTPMAACRIANVRSNGDRQILSLSCTTSISNDTAHAFLAPAPDGGLYRYLSAEGGVATKFQRCDRAKLTTGSAGGAAGQTASLGRRAS
ncbi:hypothetical protein [Bosea thiooxidans]